MTKMPPSPFHLSSPSPLSISPRLASSLPRRWLGWFLPAPPLLLLLARRPASLAAPARTVRAASTPSRLPPFLPRARARAPRAGVNRFWEGGGAARPASLVPPPPLAVRHRRYSFFSLSSLPPLHEPAAWW